MTNDRFRDALEVDFKGMSIKSKTELSNLMRIARYHVKFNEKLKTLEKKFPTQKQLDGAWEYLKGEEILDGAFSRNVFNPDKTWSRSQATKDIYIRGRLYKKGQFVPMGKKKKGE